MADIEIGPVRDADTGEVIDANPTEDDGGGGSSSSSSDGGSGGGGGGSSSSSDEPDIKIGAVKDTDTGEIITPADETGSGNIPDSQKGTKAATGESSDSAGGGNEADVKLTDIEGEDGYRLTEEQLEERKQTGNIEDLAPAVPGGASLTPEQKIEKAQTLAEREQDRRESIRETLTDPKASVKEKQKALESQANLVGGQKGVKISQLNQKIDDLRNKERTTSLNRKNNRLFSKPKTTETNFNKSTTITSEQKELIRQDPSLSLPRQNSITAEPPNDFSQLPRNTISELPSGTNIRGESFLNTFKNKNTRPKNLAFQSPTAKGFKIQQDLSSKLESIGLPDRFSENVGKGVGVTTVLGEGAVQGVKQLPQDIKELVQNPEQKFEKEITNLKNTRSGKLSKNPESAALLANTKFQKQAELGQRAVDSGIALAALGQAYGGIAAKGAVRGVNAPTFKLFKSDPDIKTESFQGRVFENRLDSTKTQVDAEGQITQNQRFDTITADAQTKGIITEDKTLGKTEQPLQIVKVKDGEGQRLFAVNTKTGFKSSDEGTEGLSESTLLEISKDREIKDLKDVRKEKRIQDFKIESRQDKNLEGRIVDEKGKQEKQDVEAAVFGEVSGKDFRSLDRSKINIDTREGTVKTSTISEPGLSKGGKKRSEGEFVDLKNFDREIIEKKVDLDKKFDLEGRSFSELSEERQKQVLNQLVETGEDIFGERNKRTDSQIESEDGFKKDVDSGEDQLLVSETDSKRSSELSEKRLGIGTDQVSRQAAEEAAEKVARDDLDTDFNTNIIQDVGVGTGILTGTKIRQSEQLEEGNILDQTQRNRDINRFENIQLEEQDTGQRRDTTTITGLDTDLENFRFGKTVIRIGENPAPRGPPKNRDIPDIDLERGKDKEKNEEGFNLFGREQKRDVKRSVGADLLGIEGKELTETEATNPLSLRAIDQ